LPPRPSDITKLLDFKAQHLARFAFGNDLEWAAAYFAVGRETLHLNAGIDYHFKSLAAKGALHGL
jgi:hypothetical protein